MPLRLSILIVLATLCVGMSAHAAPRISSSKMGDFARVSFGWDTPTTMKFSTSGNVVTLSFNKVLQIVEQVEMRIDRLVGLLGGDIGNQMTETLATGKERMDESLMAGPQMSGDGVSQADVDKLFP